MTAIVGELNQLRLAVGEVDAIAAVTLRWFDARDTIELAVEAHGVSLAGDVCHPPMLTSSQRTCSGSSGGSFPRQKVSSVRATTEAYAASLTANLHVSTVPRPLRSRSARGVEAAKGPASLRDPSACAKRGAELVVPLASGNQVPLVEPAQPLRRVRRPRPQRPVRRRSRISPRSMRGCAPPCQPPEPHADPR